MKSFIFSLLTSVVLTGYAQSDKYMAAMKKNLELLDSAKTTQDYQTVANTFERIGDAEKTQWLPYYYAGLSLILSGWSDTKLDKDVNSMRVDALCDKAEALDKNAEIYLLRNMAATQQMMVDPQTRWQTYGQQASGYLQKATELDPDNPRIYYLKGQSIFNTPVSFGGGKENAKPLFEKSVDLFKKEQPKALYPRWGKDQAEMMLAKCQ
ncbi:MAG TPA: hypothetical protein VMH01_03390 [Puia sp.]|nr:hypothetical protein [Puia sp.]